MPRVVHFEISVDKPDRAIKFYRDVFGWAIETWEGPMEYWLVGTGQEGEPGIDGALTLRKEGTPPIVNSISVSSVEEFSAKITASGGKILQPKMPIPGVGYFAYCQDSEGNPFGIIKEDPTAH
jgi:uncharacterized protein